MKKPLVKRRLRIPVKLATYSGLGLATLDHVEALIQDCGKIWLANNQEAEDSIISSPEPVAKSTPELVANSVRCTHR